MTATSQDNSGGDSSLRLERLRGEVQALQVYCWEREVGTKKTRLGQAELL